MKKGLVTSCVLGASLFLGVQVGQAADAERAWKSKCASCHAADGTGKTKQGEKMKVADMTNADWQKKFTDDQIKTAITDGFSREKDGVKQEMKPFKDKLAAEDIDGLVKHIRSLKK